MRVYVYMLGDPSFSLSVSLFLSLSLSLSLYIYITLYIAEKGCGEPPLYEPM